MVVNLDESEAVLIRLYLNDTHSGFSEFAEGYGFDKDDVRRILDMFLVDVVEN